MIGALPIAPARYGSYSVEETCNPVKVERRFRNSLATPLTNIELYGLIIIMLESTIIQEKSKKGYLVTVSLIVSILLLTGWSWSLFASNFNLGYINSISELTRPIPIQQQEVEIKQPEPVRQQRTNAPQSNNEQVSIRRENIQRIDETPKEIPPVNSVIGVIQRPIGDYKIGDKDLDIQPKGRGTDTSNTDGVPQGLVQTTPIAKEEKEPEVVVKPNPKSSEVVVKKAIKRNIGVVNSKALYLAQPPYPNAAKSVRAQGQVSVVIRIDKQGNVTVISASGNPLLLQAARDAASRSKFSPTITKSTESDEATEVTGTIIYNFKL